VGKPLAKATVLDLNLTFRAVTVTKDGDRLEVSLGTRTIGSLKPGEVVVKVQYSSLNYKDILVCQGNPGLVRRYPHTPGIDAAGIVVHSLSSEFTVGDEVMVVAHPLGVSVQGGFAEYVQIEAAMVEKLPIGLSLRDVMVFGTAGFTAALAVQKLEEFGLTPTKGPVMVSGATGGVGSMAVFLLACCGYDIYAVTRTRMYEKALRDAGCAEVITMSEIYKLSDFPILKPKYAAVIDNVGGAFFAAGVRQLLEHGSLAAIGMVASDHFNVSVLPFILRGANILGVNAEASSATMRQAVWQRISRSMMERRVGPLVTEAALCDVPELIRDFETTSRFGRTVINVAG